MDPMVVDVLGCLDGGQCSDKTLLAGAVVGDAGSWPVTGRVLSGGGVPFGSEVIQSSRCTLMAKWLFGDCGVRLMGVPLTICILLSTGKGILT